MELLSKTKGIHQYLEMHRDRNEIKEMYDKGYEWEMLRYNSLQTLLTMGESQVNSGCNLYFQIDGTTSLRKRMIQQAMSRKEIQILLISIGECLLELQEYILIPDHLLLQSSYIMFNPEEKKYRFIYIPDAEGDFSSHMKVLMEEMMQLISFEDPEVLLFLCDIYKQMLVDHYSPAMYLKYLEKNGLCADGKKTSEKRMKTDLSCEGRVDISQRDESNMLLPNNSNSVDVLVDSVYREAREQSRKQCQKRRKINICIGICMLLAGMVIIWKVGADALPACGICFVFYIVYFIMIEAKNAEEMDVDEAMCQANCQSKDEEIYQANEIDKRFLAEIVKDDTKDGTGIYSKRDVREAEKEEICDTRQYLFPKNTSYHHPIPIEDFAVRIGRSKEQAEICLQAPGISRVHAEVYRKEGAVCIKDCCSTNGTYVNQTAIPAGETVTVVSGDIVSFAGEEFYLI